MCARSVEGDGMPGSRPGWMTSRASCRPDRLTSNLGGRDRSVYVPLSVVKGIVAASVHCEGARVVAVEAMTVGWSPSEEKTPVRDTIRSE